MSCATGAKAAVVTKHLRHVRQSTAWCVYKGRKGRARGCVCGVCALCLICALNGGAQPYLLIKVADMLLRGGVGGNWGGKVSEQPVLDQPHPAQGVDQCNEEVQCT